MTSNRIGLIGCGAISDFHVPALKEAGLDVVAVAGSPGSIRASEFAARHSIGRVFDSADELLDQKNEFDGILIAVPVARTLEILRATLETSLPVLVEKPISYKSADLDALRSGDYPLIVGYNRRFYRTVMEARREIETGESFTASLTLPESAARDGQIESGSLYLRSFFSNSVHGLDLAQYVLGRAEIRSVERIRSDDGLLVGLAATLRTASGVPLQFTANWGAPANFALTLDRAGRRFDLRPFEMATVYEGMQVSEPTPETPIRTYQPMLKEQLMLSPIDSTFKPGFVAQARAFRALIEGEPHTPAAGIDDAYAVLKLAEELAGTTFKGT
jgi:predicted dehydrogenase